MTRPMSHLTVMKTLRSLASNDSKRDAVAYAILIAMVLFTAAPLALTSHSVRIAVNCLSLNLI
jgi:hypothetical protein